MKGKGPREERETIIRWDEANDTAEVYTASEGVYNQMLKRGFSPDEDRERSAVFRIPKKLCKLPRHKPVWSEARRVEAKNRLMAARAHKLLGAQSKKGQSQKED